MMPFRCPIRLVLLVETPRNARQLTTITVRIFLRRRDEPQSACECAPRHSFQQLCCLYLHPDSRGIRQRRGKDQRKTIDRNARRKGLAVCRRDAGVLPSVMVSYAYEKNLQNREL